jgi:hypothetical protein
MVKILLRVCIASLIVVPAAVTANGSDQLSDLGYSTSSLETRLISPNWSGDSPSEGAESRSGFLSDNYLPRVGVKLQQSKEKTIIPKTFEITPFIQESDRPALKEQLETPGIVICSSSRPETSCCQDEINGCLFHSFTELAMSGEIPAEAALALEAVSSSDGWEYGSVPFSREFGACLRSRLHEYCFEYISKKILVFDWMRSPEGPVEIFNPRELDAEHFRW